jgi:hypothetical protein
MLRGCRGISEPGIVYLPAIQVEGMLSSLISMRRIMAMPTIACRPVDRIQRLGGVVKSCLITGRRMVCKIPPQGVFDARGQVGPLIRRISKEHIQTFVLMTYKSQHL